MTTPVQPGDIPTDLTVPQRGDPPAIFTPQYQTFLDRMNDEVVPSMNALSAYFNESNTYAAQQVSLAADQVVLAADQVALAADQVALAADQVALAADQVSLAEAEAVRSEDAANKSTASANLKGEWSELTGALTLPSSVYHNGLFWALLVDLSDVTISEPSESNPDWALMQTIPERLTIDTPFTITAKGKYFVRGNGNVTLPDVSSMNNETYSFVAEIGSKPKIYGNTATDILTKNFGEVDFIELDNQAEYVFIYNSNSGKLEI